MIIISKINFIRIFQIGKQYLLLFYRYIARTSISSAILLGQQSGLQYCQDINMVCNIARTSIQSAILLGHQYGLQYCQMSLGHQYGLQYCQMSLGHQYGLQYCQNINMVCNIARTSIWSATLLDVARTSLVCSIAGTSIWSAILLGHQYGLQYCQDINMVCNLGIIIASSYLR